MTFQFRFQSLLDIQKQDRDEVGAAVGQANEAVRKIDDRITETLEQIKESRSEQSGGQVGTVSVDAMLTQDRYKLQLQADHQSLLETRESLLQEVRRRQGFLALAEAEVKKFEKLCEHDRESYTKQQLKREQEEIDDRVSARYIMQRRKMQEIEKSGG